MFPGARSRGCNAHRRALAVVVTAVAMISLTSLSAADAKNAPARARSNNQIRGGRLMVAHGDNFTTGAMVMQTKLRTASGDVPLVVPASAHATVLALAGHGVQVRGSRIAASSTVQPKVAHAVGAMRIAVVLMRLPGSTAEPVSKAAVKMSTFGPTNSVAQWYSQMSGGQVAVTGTVYGYFPGVRTCDLSTQLDAAAAAARRSGYVASNYDHLVVYTPTQSCAFAGIGWVGENGVFLNGSTTPGLMEHELGHNLGVWHAGRYACGAAPFSAKCLLVYGDPADVMGDPYSNHGYSAEHKHALGWIPDAEVRTVASGTQTIALTASEDPVVAGSTELIHLRATDGTLYAIDRRASIGYDAGLSGVWIRRVASLNSDDTQLVRNGALGAGATFTDPVHHVTIKTLADSGPRASVQVCVGACTAARKPTAQ